MEQEERWGQFKPISALRTLRCRKRENKGAKDEQEEKLSSLIQQQQSRKLMASLSSKSSLLKTMLGTSLSSFFLCTVVRKGLCWLLSWPGNESAREMCSLPLQSLEQTGLESAVAASTGSFGENSHGKSGNLMTFGQRNLAFH